MPGLDRTGPEGQGPKTGRGMGKCNPDIDESSTTRQGMGFGRGRGRFQGRGRRGRGWRMSST